MKQFWESAKKIEKNVMKQYLLDMYNMPKIETMDDVFRSLTYL
jgi:DNA-directed RNA polymerase subunit H (RpoH/RPB5)